MGISGLQRRCNQRLRLPGNKKRTHSRGSHPHSQSRSRGPALLGSQPSAQLTQGGELGSWAENTRGPRHLGSEGRVSKMSADVDKEVISLTYLGSSQKMHVDSNCPKPSASLAPLPCGLPSIRSLRRAPGTVQEREERGGLTRRRAPNRKIDSVPPGGSADLGPRAPRTLGLGVPTCHCRKLLACYRFSVTRKCFSKTSSYNQVYEILLIPNLISGVRSSCCHGDGQASPRPLMRPPGPGHSGRSGQLRGRLTCLVLSPRKPVQAILAFLPHPLNSSGLDSIPGTFYLWRGRHSPADQAWASLGTVVNKDLGNCAECAVNTPAPATEEASTPGNICVYLGDGAANRAADI
ncbi:hypothetical protein JEQ12_008657 [Ovis aries]|uniref:Uncharacterized protein n=1 Tax=Ovis aries TaxID=9940 RepID=A0A836D4P2_SHEEP|nr:hypothetical protein JEQ12_008657 [Ovis aries]